MVQEAHLRIFEYQRHTVVREVDSLLRRIVINLSITFYHRELVDPPICDSIERADRQGRLVEERSGLDEALLAEQCLEAVANLLGAISERTCQIFLMQRGGYKYEEIASAFAIKPRTVEKHVKRAVLEIEGRQIRHGFEPAGSTPRIADLSALANLRLQLTTQSTGGTGVMVCHVRKPSLD